MRELVFDLEYEPGCDTVADTLAEYPDARVRSLSLHATAESLWRVDHVTGSPDALAAIETADIALMGDDIGKLPYLYALSNRANGVIRQNIWSSLGVKALLALGVPLGLVSVALAVVVGDMGMSLGVTGNSMRLSRMTPDRFRGS
jgi:Cd2+/Zn2+-exporting ATPase